MKYKSKQWFWEYLVLLFSLNANHRGTLCSLSVSKTSNMLKRSDLKVEWECTNQNAYVTFQIVQFTASQFEGMKIALNLS